MRLCRVVLFASVVATVMVQNAVAESAASVGAELAREWCSRCHHVEPDGPFKQHPPSFASIAVFRSETQIYGRIAFPPLHTSMPQIGYLLTPDAMEKLVAYIVSLEPE